MTIPDNSRQSPPYVSYEGRIFQTLVTQVHQTLIQDTHIRWDIKYTKLLAMGANLGLQ